MSLLKSIYKLTGIIVDFKERLMNPNSATSAKQSGKHSNTKGISIELGIARCDMISHILSSQSLEEPTQ